MNDAVRKIILIENPCHHCSDEHRCNHAWGCVVAKGNEHVSKIGATWHRIDIYKTNVILGNTVEKWEHAHLKKLMLVRCTGMKTSRVKERRLISAGHSVIIAVDRQSENHNIANCDVDDRVASPGDPMVVGILPGWLCGRWCKRRCRHDNLSKHVVIQQVSVWVHARHVECKRVRASGFLHTRVKEGAANIDGCDGVIVAVEVPYPLNSVTNIHSRNETQRCVVSPVDTKGLKLQSLCRCGGCGLTCAADRRGCCCERCS